PPHLHSFPTRRSSDLRRPKSLLRPGKADAIRLPGRARSGCDLVNAPTAPLKRKYSALSEMSRRASRRSVAGLAKKYLGDLTRASDRKSTRLNSSHVAI